MGAGGIPPVSQPYALISSAAAPTSSALHTGSQPRAGYARESSLRGSASLQDFSLYRTGSLSNGVARSASSAAGFGSAAHSQQALRSDSLPVSFSTFKSSLLRKPSGSLVSPFYNNNGVCAKGKYLCALTALVGALLLLSVLWGGYSRAQSSLEYAVVIDCGSTGTRIHVYGWTRSGLLGKESLPVMLKPAPDKPVRGQRNDGAPSFDGKGGGSRLYNRMETFPGLDKLLHNESGVASAIEPLLSWATKQIPRASQGNTKLFFLATAGLRRLPSTDSTWLLDKAWSVLARSPFTCRREWVRVISGKEEAYYGWIALNYNQKKLGYFEKQPTLGALDLGGSSLEVTFEPLDEIFNPDYFVNVSVGAAEHHLYAHSHSGFGLNDAFEKSVALLMQSSGDGRNHQQVSHPCLNSGYKRPYICSSHCLLPPSASAHEPHKGRRSVLAAKGQAPKVELVGKPNWSACESLVRSVINTSRISPTSETGNCEKSACALGTYQPKPQGDFFALTGFFVVFKFFGLTSANTLSDLLQSGEEFCKLTWEEAQQSVVSQPSIDRYCFRAPYVVALLRQGLNLNDGQISIGSGDFAWTLGAALNEAGALLSVNHRHGQARTSLSGMRQSAFPLDVHSLAFLFVVIILAILLLAAFGHWITSHPVHRSYLPLFVTPTMSNRPFCWLPTAFRSQTRNGSNSGTAAGAPLGEIRTKQPHSPAPSDAKSFHHQMLESGDKHAGGDGPVLECDVLQHSSGASTTSVGGRPQIQVAPVKVQQKGRAQLQSRRSQSREDLSAYVSPEILHISKVKLPREISPVRMFAPLRHDFSI